MFAYVWPCRGPSGAVSLPEGGSHPNCFCIVTDMKSAYPLFVAIIYPVSIQYLGSLLKQVCPCHSCVELLLLCMWLAKYG